MLENQGIPGSLNVSTFKLTAMKTTTSSQTSTLPDIVFPSSYPPNQIYIKTGPHKSTDARSPTNQRKAEHQMLDGLSANHAGHKSNHSENGTKRVPKKEETEDQKDSLKLPALQSSSRSPSLASTPNVSPRKSTPSVSPHLPNNKDTDAGKSKHEQTFGKSRKSKLKCQGNENNSFPDVNIKYLDKREDTKDMIKSQETVPIPLSQTDRKVTVVRNAMYGNFLRKSTKKLQDDLRQTMRVYSSEKHELLRQLANLRHEMDELKVSETSSSPTSSLSDTSSSSRVTPRFFHAPNVAAHKVGKKGKRRRKTSPSSDSSMGSQNQKARDGILRLPTIQDASPAPQSEWESGNSMHTNLPPIDPPKGLAAAKALMDNTFPIPKTSDPHREDISVSDLVSKRSSREKKKVHFSEENKVTEFEVIRYTDSEAKNWQNAGEDNSFPQDHFYRRPRVSKKGKGERGSRVTLAPLKRPNDPKEAQKVAAEYKSLYLSIHDPEERTKTLADILYAVRMRMQENEQNLKFGESPRPAKTNNTLCDFLLSNSLNDDPLLRAESSKQGKQFLGAPNHTAARIGRRSHSIQLQNYLRKMSKSRRMIEHMEAEQYRLAHIIGHKQLMAATQVSHA